MACMRLLLPACVFLSTLMVNAWPLLWFRWSLERFYSAAFILFLSQVWFPVTVRWEESLRGFVFFFFSDLSRWCIFRSVRCLSEACSCMPLLSDPESNFRYFQFGLLLWKQICGSVSGLCCFFLKSSLSLFCPSAAVLLCSFFWVFLI